MIRNCCPPYVPGPPLRSRVAAHPLRPATRLSLGEPLPHQQADRPRTPHKAPLQALVSET